MNYCVRCGAKPFVRATPELLLCRSCFSERIEKRVAKTIKQYNMLHYGCHVVVGLSGGKDSSVLLTILKKISLSGTRITAVIIDEGIEGYRPDGVKEALKIAEGLGVESFVYSYRSLFGYTLDSMLEVPPFGKSSCGVCGTFRRKALNQAAADLLADYVATGHNLDDEAESILLNLVRGDFDRFTRQTRTPLEQDRKSFVPKIKPLVLISQPEIVYYALANGIDYYDGTCPYADQARRNSIRNFLFDQEKRHPGTLLNLVRMQDKLSLSYRDEILPLLTAINPCTVCGDPTDSTTALCAGCKFIQEIEHQKRDQ